MGRDARRGCLRLTWSLACSVSFPEASASSRSCGCCMSTARAAPGGSWALWCSSIARWVVQVEGAGGEQPVTVSQSRGQVPGHLGLWMGPKSQSLLGGSLEVTPPHTVVPVSSVYQFDARPVPPSSGLGTRDHCVLQKHRWGKKSMRLRNLKPGKSRTGQLT
jgi:hypothetical protein